VARMLVESCTMCINNSNLVLTDCTVLQLRRRRDACNNQRNITNSDRHQVRAPQLENRVVGKPTANRHNRRWYMRVVHRHHSNYPHSRLILTKVLFQMMVQ
jgi:hypothetical protein